MSYLGNQPAIGKFTLCDDLTPDGSTTTFSLTSSSNAVVPGSVNAMLVSINGVIQAPSTYTINGSQIIFSTAPGSGDVIDQIRVFGSVLNVGTVSDGTISTAKIIDSAVTTAKLNDASVSLAKLTATGTKDATTFLRGDNTFQTIGTNTPAFLVRLTGNQSVANNTNTILSFNREALDTDSNYDSTNYRFVPQVEGYYKIGVRITSQGTGAAQSLNIYKNASTVTEYQVNAAASTTNSQINEALVYMNGSSDYVDARVYQSSGSSKDYYGADYNCQFYGFRVIGI